MIPGADSHVIHWLALLGQNVALGMAVVGIYATLRASIEETRSEVRTLTLGVLFGACGIVSMLFPIQIYDGMRLDLRSIFVAVGSLYGGPLGAFVATAMPVAFRVYLGATGHLAGIVSNVCVGLFAYLLARYTRKPQTEFGVATLFVAGLCNAAVTVFFGMLFSAPSVPMEANIALFVLAPVATVILGTSLSMVHPRVWRRTERLLADIVETTSEMVWEHDPEARLTFASERCIEVLGIPAGEVVGRTAAELGWFPVDESARQIYEAAMTERRPIINIVFARRIPGKAPRLVSVTGKPAFSAPGRFVGYRGVASNVTDVEKWRALTANLTYRLSNLVGEEFFRALVQIVTEMLGVRSAYVSRFDLSARMIGGNFAFTSDPSNQTVAFEGTQTSFEGLPAETVACGIPLVVSEGVTKKFQRMNEIEFFRGMEAYAAVPLLGAGGQVLGLLGVVDTKPWESPDYVETVLTLFAGRAAAEIERTIVEEEREESRRQLSEREAQAGKIEALGNLAGGIAHDFNNLLGAILGFGQFLAEDLQGTPELHRYAKRIVDVSQRGRALVDQILTFARSTTVAPSTVSLEELMAETHDLLRATIPATTQLSIDNKLKDFTVLADKTQLVQVIVNLCINGSDALDSEPGTVRIALERLDRSRPELARLPVASGKPTPGYVEKWREPDGAVLIGTGAVPSGNCLSLTVTDTGSGMPDSILGQMFEPFRTTKSAGRGTGLGLAVVHRIVREHGGAILVRTAAGKGTRFEIVLGDLARRARASASGSAASTNGASAPLASVLVVDDDVDYCEMVKTALTRLGHKVETTNDPRVALEWAERRAGDWDVLVTDNTMPHMRGRDLIRGFKVHNASTRCIICTGFGGNLSERDAAAAGADALLLKPFDIGQLEKIVAQMMLPPPA